jgi:hypothetical protein
LIVKKKFSYLSYKWVESDGIGPNIQMLTQVAEISSSPSTIGQRSLYRPAIPSPRLLLLLLHRGQVARPAWARSGRLTALVCPGRHGGIFVPARRAAAAADQLLLTFLLHG